MAVGMFAAMREALSDGPASAAELFEHVELAETPRQVSKALYEMKQKGQVERLDGPVRGGKWTLTDKGQSLLGDDLTEDEDDAPQPFSGADDAGDAAEHEPPEDAVDDEGEDLPVNPVRPLASPFREAVESAPERPFVRPLGEEVLEHASAAAAHMQMVLESYIEEHEDPLLREMLAACQRSEATLEALKAWLR